MNTARIRSVQSVRNISKCEVIMHLFMYVPIPIVFLIVFLPTIRMKEREFQHTAMVSCIHPFYIYGHFCYCISLILRGLREKICLGKQPSCATSSYIYWHHLNSKQQPRQQGSTSTCKFTTDTISSFIYQRKTKRITNPKTFIPNISSSLSYFYNCSTPFITPITYGIGHRASTRPNHWLPWWHLYCTTRYLQERQWQQ